MRALKLFVSSLVTALKELRRDTAGFDSRSDRIFEPALYAGMKPGLAARLQAACGHCRRSYELDKRLVQCYIAGTVDSAELAAIVTESNGFIVIESRRLRMKMATAGVVTWDEVLSHMNLGLGYPVSPK